VPSVASSPEPAVAVHDAVVLLGGFPALAGASLVVEPGEIVLLRGPNGAGKTTLLRLCATLAPLSSGSARVLGLDVAADRHEIRRRVGYLGHATGLYDDLTVADNVRFWAQASGADRTEADTAMAAVELIGRLPSTKVGRLSAGQRRRTALAALLARRPQLWLLDEPHAGLDADGRDLLDGLIRRAAGQGATVVLASHELDRAVPLADREVVVDGGRVLDAGPDAGPDADAGAGSDAGVARVP
jgi:heme ABC exporter ATP-binding subunit CcmA